MARLSCERCGHEWVRKTKWSHGQLIRCPKCRVTLGKMSTQIKPMTTKEYVVKKGMNEWE